jgi:hypothetical protein
MLMKAAIFKQIYACTFWKEKCLCSLQSEKNLHIIHLFTAQHNIHSKI